MRLALRHPLTAAFVAASAILLSHSPAPLPFSFVPRVSAAERPDLQGTWILNKDLGSDPIGELETRRPSRPIGAGGMGGPGSGGGLGGPLIGGTRQDRSRGRRGDGAGQGDAAADRWRLPRRSPSASTGPLIEIAGEDGTVHRLHADGKKFRDRSYPGLEFERKTKWDGDVLVTEFELKDSEAKAKQTWTRTGTRLRVLTKLTPPHGAEPLEVQRGYDLEAAEK